MNVFKKTTAYAYLIPLLVFVVLVFPDIAIAGALDDIFLKFYYGIVVGLGGLVAWLGGGLLNFSISSFVVGFGDLFINNGVGHSVDKLWSIVRDIFNLTFIFGLVFIGFKIIFGDNSARRTLATLILAALLVNFSLFITKFVIDFSNIAAAQFANGFLDASNAEYAVSEKFMQLLGISNFFSISGAGTLPPGSTFISVTLTFILFIVAGFVFFAGGIMLTIRFVVLNIYMILSPVMFLGWVFPGFSGASKKYWSGFLERAFFAPAYILMIYLSYEVLANMKMSGTGKSIKDVSELKITYVTETIPFFIMAIVFLIASLTVAQKMGAQGAASSIAIGNRLTGKAKTYAGAAAALGAQRGINRLASTDPTKNGWFNNGLRSVARRANVLGADAALGKAAKPVTVWGENSKKNKVDQANRDSAARRSETVKAGIAAQDELKKLTSVGPLSPQQLLRKGELEQIIDKMAVAVGGMSTKLLENMSEKELGSVYEFLTSSQVENLLKSDNLSDKAKDSLVKGRQEMIQKILAVGGPDTLIDQITKLSVEEIETMGDTWVDNHVIHFTKSQMEGLKKSKKFTTTRQNGFADKRKSHRAGVMATRNGADIKTLFENSPGKRKKPEDVADLGAAVLLDPMSAEYIQAEDLEAIASKQTLTYPERIQLRNNLFATGFTHPNLNSIYGYLTSPHGQRNW